MIGPNFLSSITRAITSRYHDRVLSRPCDIFSTGAIVRIAKNDRQHKIVAVLCDFLASTIAPRVRRVRVENLIPRFNYNVSIGFVGKLQPIAWRDVHASILFTSLLNCRQYACIRICCSCIRPPWPVTTKGLDRELDESPAIIRIPTVELVEL